jgi:Peptidase family M28/PA domain
MKAFLAAIDSRRAYEHAAWLTTNAPFRQSGTDRERRAAAYIAEHLASYGCEVTVHELAGYVGFPNGGALAVTAPEPAEVPISVFAHSSATPPAGIETELVFCGHGAETDFARTDVRGKIVLTYLSFTPSRPEKARLAAVHGAAGILMMHFLSGAYDNLPEGTVKAIWGNPTDRDFGALQGTLPAAGVRRADGEQLLRRLSRGPVRVRLRVDAERRWVTLPLPVGVLRGTAEPRFSLVGGHLCSWSGGATDNASGDGGILELARAAAAHRERLRRGVMFAAWPAHEQGIMEGSTWFVDAMWDLLDRDCLLYVNLDEMGKRGTAAMEAHCSPEAAGLASGAVRDALGLEAVTTRDLHKSGDQSFFGIGVPSVWIRSKPDAATLEAWRGADSGWWWHTAADTLDKLDPEVQQRELLAAGAVLWRLSTAPVLPFRFTPVARRLAERLNVLQRVAGEHLDLAPVMRCAVDFQVRAAAFDDASEAGRETNAAQMRLSRVLTPVTSTVAGRWAQDTYGLSDLATYLPGLRAAEELPRLRGRDEYHLVLTRLLRERNRVRDAVYEACRLIETSGVV